MRPTVGATGRFVPPQHAGASGRARGGPAAIHARRRGGPDPLIRVILTRLVARRAESGGRAADVLGGARAAGLPGGTAERPHSRRSRDPRRTRGTAGGSPDGARRSSPVLLIEVLHLGGGQGCGRRRGAGRCRQGGVGGEVVAAPVSARARGQRWTRTTANRPSTLRLSRTSGTTTLQAGRARLPRRAGRHVAEPRGTRVRRCSAWSPAPRGPGGLLAARAAGVGRSERARMVDARRALRPGSRACVTPVEAPPVR